MNQPNKVNLILLIAQRFTDDMCAYVLERFNNHPLLIANKLANEALNWHEDLHPRHNDGRFAPKGQGEERAYSEEEIDENRRKWRQNVEDAKKLRRRKPGSGYTLDEYDQLELGEIDKIRDVFEMPSWESDQNGNWRPSPKMKRVLDLVKRIDKIREIDRENAKKDKGEKNQKRYDRYNEIDDELTRMVETYGTEGLTGKIKKDGTSADKKTREAFRQLQREQKKLERQIDWQALDEEPDVDDSTRSLDDDNYRPDDPPSRTPEAADEADREMFREWTKNIPREKWTKDMQTEYKRLFGKR